MELYILMNVDKINECINKSLLLFLLVYSERNDCYIVGEEKNIYTGNKSTTITGRTCQSWSSTVPHSHNYLNNPEAEGNYCRILTDSKPWCFTVDKSVRWEYCGIPECCKCSN